MNNDKELQLEVVQALDWEPRFNAGNIGLTVEDGVIMLSGDVRSLLEKMALGRSAQPESRTSGSKPPYIAGLLVIRGRGADILPARSARTAILPSWVGASTATSHVGPEVLLSARESEVLSLIAAGQSNQEIAQQLCLALNTVKRHAYNIYAKLDVKKRTQAVSRARQLGLIA